MHFCRRGALVVFAAGLILACAQSDYTHMTDMNLCDKRLGFEPNGEYLAQPGDNLTVHVNWTFVAQHRCLMWFRTCNFCRLHVQAVSSFHYPACSSPTAYREYNGWCVPGCSYVHLYDKTYSNQTAQSYTSSSSSNSVNGVRVLDFRTESSHLYVVGCANKTRDSHVFINLRITAEDKTQTFTGSSIGNHRDQVFSSPFFPDEYALDSEVYKYVFQAATQDEFITISFDDWQLSQYSYIRFDNANIRGDIPGSNQRPWIISDTHRLEMTFNTGYDKYPGTYKAFKGFRATYKFIHNSKRDDITSVQTNCGFPVGDQESRTIEFNPTSNGLDYNDCIWVIKKNPNFEKVMVKVIKHSTRYPSSPNEPNLFEIREGLTSLGTLVDSGVASLYPQELTFHEHVSDVGFYVRLKGHYYGRKDFVLAFTSFNVDNCKRLFKCDNSRCVPSTVTCNDIDNCGDNSDESYNAGCGRTVPSEESKRSSPITIGIIIPLVVSVFLIVVICLLILFIRRCRRLSCQARRAQRLRQQHNMSNGSANRQHRRHRRRGETGDENGTPADPPPTYEDVLSNTPIGYLNLGFTDASYHPAGPVQPPSYEEATSPTTENPAISFQGSGSHDLSTDSSSPETIGRSQANISTSYSSDETGTSRNHRRHRHRAASVSSSDSSTDDRDLLGVAVIGQDREGGGSNNHRERNQPNNRRSIAKPDSAEIEPPVTSSKDIALKKNAKSNKLGNRQQKDLDGVAVIRLPSEGETALPSDPDSREGSSGQWSTGSLETSPLILNPASLLPTSSLQGQSAATTAQREGRASSMDTSHPARSRSECNLTDDHSSHHTLNEDKPNAPDDQSSGRRDRYSRTSPSKNVPAHIRRAKGPSKGLMKHLSKSMDNISRHSEGGEFDQERAALSNRQFSRSVQNLARDGSQGDTDHPYAASLQRGLAHHQSQPLALHHDGPSDQGRTVEQHPEHQERQSKAQSLHRERNFHNQPRDATAPDLRGRYEPEARSRPAHPQARPAQPHWDQREQDSHGITGEGRGSHFDQSRSPRRYNARHGHDGTWAGNEPEQHSHGRAGEGRGGHFNQSRSPPRYNTRPGHDEAPAALLHQAHPYSHSLDRQKGGNEQGREQSGLHAQRKAASLDRNGLQPGRGPPNGHSECPDPRKDPPPGHPARPQVPPYAGQGTRHYPSRSQDPHSPTRDQPPSSWNGAANPPPYRAPDRNRAQIPANNRAQPSSDANDSRLYDPPYTDGHNNQNRPMKTESPGSIPYAPNQNRHPAPKYPRSEHPPKPARATQPPNSSGPASGLGAHAESRNPDSAGPHHDKQRFQQRPSSGPARERTLQIPVETSSSGSAKSPFQNVGPGSAEVSSHNAALSSSPTGRGYPQHSPLYGQQQTYKPAHTSLAAPNRAALHSPSDGGGGGSGSAYGRHPYFPREHEGARSGSGGQSDHMPKDHLKMKLSNAAESSPPSSVAVLPESPIRVLPEAHGAGMTADLPLRMGGVVEPEDDIFV